MENSTLEALLKPETRPGSRRGAASVGAESENPVSRPIYEFDVVTGAPLMFPPRALRNRLPTPAALASASTSTSAAPSTSARPVRPAPKPPEDPNAPATLAEARERLERSAARIAELEEGLRTTLERLGRRTTEVRNLTARLEAATSTGSASTPAVLVTGAGDVDPVAPDRMTVTRDQSRALGQLVGVLREEMTKRDAALRDRDARIARLEREHAAAVAEISRLCALVRPAPVLPETPPAPTPPAA